ncbi:MAG TPA: hypothetical protein VGW12_22670 [Pyrinomonadaceae bacterium]|nr:hypothetical protein [Pyrinomonadaceae bacterium]
MSTEFNRGSKGKDFAQFLRGSIEAGELHRAQLEERPPEAGVYASPAKKAGVTKAKTCAPTVNPCCKPPGKLEATKEKTCKPTRNPCCRGVGEEAPGKVETTKAKTCKPTRNPCCKPPGDVEATKAKTCKPTRNPCCKAKAPAKKAHGRADDYFGGAAPIDRLFI